jgi:endonuclease YncB( thermonuclease family)
VTATEWMIVTVVSITDGDTVRLIRERHIELDGRRYLLMDDYDEKPHGEPIRLVWVDTPERGQDGYAQARMDVANWFAEHNSGMGSLFVYCYESAGWDRILGDVVDVSGNSLSQWLMVEKGWAPYVKGK